MKTLNFRKLGLLLVMMLLGGMALVGPVSADGIEADGGAYISGSSIIYHGSAGYLGETCDVISVQAEVTDLWNNVVVSNTGTISKTNTNYVSTGNWYFSPFYTDDIYELYVRAASTGPTDYDHYFQDIIT
ncbi:hypothetical protein [Methanolacinia paynteri]|uniref:hypothetical protein n=1 Tax=Methanolacinia paynteri TaxID=230356 RepID=UPI00064E5C50|nr:hypothetical protein [Methanolacinia paynteri]